MITDYIPNMKIMKFVNLSYNLFVVVLALLVVNYFMEIVAIPAWLMIVVLVVAALLFFARQYDRFGRH